MATSGPIRSWQYQSPENHWWGGDFSQGIGGSAIGKDYAVTGDLSRISGDWRYSPTPKVWKQLGEVQCR